MNLEARSDIKRIGDANSTKNLTTSIILTSMRRPCHPSLRPRYKESGLPTTAVAKYTDSLHPTSQIEELFPLNGSSKPTNDNNRFALLGISPSAGKFLNKGPSEVGTPSISHTRLFVFGTTPVCNKLLTIQPSTRHKPI